MLYMMLIFVMFIILFDWKSDHLLYILYSAYRKGLLLHIAYYILHMMLPIITLIM